MLFKAIVDGRVIPCRSPELVGVRLAQARLARQTFRAVAVPGFPARMVERSLTADEADAAVAVAARVIREGSWSPR